MAPDRYVSLGGQGRGTFSGSPKGGSSAVVAGQGVPFSRTAAGAEGSFTTTTVTLPASAKPTKVVVGVSTSSAQVQVVSVGKRFFAGVVTPNLPLEVDISALPPGTSVDVQTEANAALVISGVVGYTD